MKTIIDRNRTPTRPTRGLHPSCAPSSTEVAEARQTPVQPGPRTRFGPGRGVYEIVTTAEESRGTIFAFEATEPPGGGPPLHIHRTEEEYFFVLEGEITFYIGGRVIVAKEGESAFVPRGTAHCFKNCSDSQARLLILFTPGNIEGFFDFGLPVDGAAPSEEVVLNRLKEFAPKFNLEVLGPSPL